MLPQSAASLNLRVNSCGIAAPCDLAPSRLVQMAGNVALVIHQIAIISDLDKTREMELRIKPGDSALAMPVSWLALRACPLYFAFRVRLALCPVCTCVVARFGRSSAVLGFRARFAVCLVCIPSWLVMSASVLNLPQLCKQDVFLPCVLMSYCPLRQWFVNCLVLAKCFARCYSSFYLRGFTWVMLLMLATAGMQAHASASSMKSDKWTRWI